MADPASAPRDLLSELALAAVGAVALSAERIDEMAEAMIARGPITTVEEARSFLRDQVARWREEAAKAGAQAGSWVGSLAREAGLVSREEADELELRVAQLEHRLQLLEREADSRP
jgi:polyhydroxyalkanoate synthesis regulator phasin